MWKFWISFAISTTLTMLSVAIKNPETKEKYKEVLYNLYLQILLTYPEFKNL